MYHWGLGYHQGSPIDPLIFAATTTKKGCFQAGSRFFFLSLTREPQLCDNTMKEQIGVQVRLTIPPWRDTKGNTAPTWAPCFSSAFHCSSFPNRAVFSALQSPSGVYGWQGLQETRWERESILFIKLLNCQFVLFPSLPPPPKCRYHAQSNTIQTYL